MGFEEAVGLSSTTTLVMFTTPIKAAFFHCTVARDFTGFGTCGGVARSREVEHNAVGPFWESEEGNAGWRERKIEVGGRLWRL